MKKLINYCKKCESQYNNFKKYHPFVRDYYKKIKSEENSTEMEWIPEIQKLKEEIVKLTY